MGKASQSDFFTQANHRLLSEGKARAQLETLPEIDDEQSPPKTRDGVASAREGMTISPHPRVVLFGGDLGSLDLS